MKSIFYEQKPRKRGINSERERFGNITNTLSSNNTIKYKWRISKKVRSRTGVVELGQKLGESRLRWWGHIIRREESYVGRRMRNLVVGRRRRGRPKRRWQGCIDDDLRAIARKEEDALDRKNGEGLSAPATRTNENEAVEDDC